MLFSNLLFIYIFLPVLFLLYFPIKSLAWRNSILVVFSLIFYAWGEPVYVLLMIGCVALNYVAGLVIDKFRLSERHGAAKAALTAAVLINLGALFFFKYAGFAIQTVNDAFGFALTVPKIALPLGISFFTFQAMSYTIDVYRGDTPSQRSFGRLLLYVSLFPQLIAGPIVRYKDIALQLENRTVDAAKLSDGIFRFALGLGKKVLIANPCGSAAGLLFGVSLDTATVTGQWAGALFFAMQIYFDFSGYSDMAIGLGKMFGFDFLENFDYPYISRSVTGFWRRWHISLGTFFRDYVYIPLGGNRKFWLRNVLVVWLATGAWHGASWNFIVWGLFYALLLIVEKTVFFRFKGVEKNPFIVLISYIYMAAVTLIGWTIFYYTDGFLLRLKIMFGAGGLSDVFTASVLKSNVFLLCAAVLLSTPILSRLMTKFLGWLGDSQGYNAGRVLKTVFIIAVVSMSTVMLAGNTYNPFLYFRF